jgi:hypothetical protein
LKEFIAFMEQRQGRFDIFEKLHAEVTKVVEVLRIKGGLIETIIDDWESIPPVYMGVDLILEDTLKVWVLELQKRPATGGAWPMEEFNTPFFKDMFDLVHNRSESGVANKTTWSRIG